MGSIRMFTLYTHYSIIPILQYSVACGPYSLQKSLKLFTAVKNSRIITTQQ
jgi:hypothetical protein